METKNELNPEGCQLCGNPDFNPYTQEWNPALCPCCTYAECQGPVDDSGKRIEE